jgi:hypothetical protein
MSTTKRRRKRIETHTLRKKRKNVSPVSVFRGRQMKKENDCGVQN